MRAAPGRPPPRRLRVVHVVGGVRTGCTLLVLKMVSRHDRARFDPALCFFTMVPAEPEVIASARGMGVPYRDVVKDRGLDLAVVPRLARALRELGCDLVVLHGFSGYSHGALAARLAGVRAVVRVEHSPELHGRSHELASRVTARLAHSTVLVSRYLERYLAARGTAPPHPEVIHNGIELAPFLAAPPPFSGGVPTALMAARLDTSKDHATLLRAMKLLAGRAVPLRLQLAGAGALAGEIRAMIHDLGLDDRVELLGHREDMPALLGAADVAVLSTRFEGFGLAVAEAMAAGRPVVATAVASLPELVEDGTSGLLVPPGSDERLADALAALVADPARARAMGEAGRRRAVERFGLERAVAAFERHLAQTAARRGLELPAAATPATAIDPPPGAERSPAGAPPIHVMARAREAPLRVLHLINDLGTGGAEQVVASLVAHGAPSVTCAVARLNDEGQLDAAVRRAGAEVYPLGVAGASDLPGALWRLGALARRFRPDLIHTHLLHAEILGGALARTLGIPAVATVHSLIWSEPGRYGPVLRSLYERTLRTNDHTVAVIEAVARLIAASGVPVDKLTVIPNGIAATALRPRGEARQRLSVPGDAFVIGAVGNLFLYKGHDLLLEATARLAAERPDVHLVVVGHPVPPGEGGTRDHLVARASQLGIADRLHLPGRVPEAASLLAAFDVYAQPSRTEGASIAFLEALAAGLPSVVTRAGGMPDVLGDSGAAVMVPPDDVDALAAALARLVDDGDARTALSARARAHARQFTAGRMAAAYELVYEQVLARRRGRRPGERALERPAAGGAAG